MSGAWVGPTPATGDDVAVDIAAVLERHVIIGEAKGILMERFDLSREDAFAFLARRSQELNVKLHVLAEQLARTREVP